MSERDYTDYIADIPQSHGKSWQECVTGLSMGMMLLTLQYSGVQ